MAEMAKLSGGIERKADGAEWTAHNKVGADLQVRGRVYGVLRVVDEMAATNNSLTLGPPPGHPEYVDERF